MDGKRIICVVGTRPEAIKMAPVIQVLNRASWAQVKVLATAQHRQLLDQILSLFQIEPDIDLNLMETDQTLTALTARLLITLDEILAQEKPDLVLAQGDTTTVMATALTCFYHQIPFGHVEAGLRTGDLANPFPEELNRVMVARLCRWHFAPTEGARRNLLREGIPENMIYVTGNTVIDALQQVVRTDTPIGVPLDVSKRMILMTAHRRENFGEPLQEICRAVRTLVDYNRDLEILYPVHPNPNVADTVLRELGQFARIKLCLPLDYPAFVAAMNRAYFILTDSGGVQEEATALAKPVLLLRHKTERPEGVAAGMVRLVGTHYDSILKHAQTLLDDQSVYQAMTVGKSPYGDGRAAEYITAILHDALQS